MRANDIPDTIRISISAKEAKKLLIHLKNWEGKLSEQWKSRATSNQSTIDKGDPYGYAEMVKSLSVMREQNALSMTDRRHLNLGMEFLCEELANALGKSHKRVRQLIEEATASEPAVA